MGSFELWAWIGLAITVAVVVTSGIDSDNFVPIFTFGASSIAVRLAVVLEYARCDDDGISWRSLFAADSATWDDVVAVEISARPYRLIGFGRIFRGHGVLAPCIAVTTTDGVAHWVSASVQCSLQHQLEFINSARRICPNEWEDPDEFVDRGRDEPRWRRPSRRVRRPGA